MSFDLFVWHARTRTIASDAQAHYEHHAKGEAEHVDESAEIGAFLEQLSAKFPSIDECDEDAVDECPWADGFERGDQHAFLSIRWSRAEVMAPIVIKLALDYGLSCYDPQEEVVHQPESLPATQR